MESRKPPLGGKGEERSPRNSGERSPRNSGGRSPAKSGVRRAVKGEDKIPGKSTRRSPTAGEGRGFRKNETSRPDQEEERRPRKSGDRNISKKEERSPAKSTRRNSPSEEGRSSRKSEERSPRKTVDRRFVKKEERSPAKSTRRTPKSGEALNPGKDETRSPGKADWRKPAARDQRGAVKRGGRSSIHGEERNPARGESRRPQRTEATSPGNIREGNPRRREERIPGNREEPIVRKGRDRNPNKGVERVPFKAGEKISKKEGESIAGMRLNKYLSHCGIASRRAADTLIMQGHVTVNGVVVQEMGYKVQENDVVVFKGKPIRPVDKLVYYLLNKPRNVLSTSSDERGRKTVIDIMSEKIPERIYPVGRLDRNTSGLILLTNDGELTKKLSHPSHKVPKVYHVTLDKNLSLKEFEEIRSGITLEDGEIKADSLHFIEGLSKREVEIELHSGRNRIVRRIFEHFGYEITKLDRVYYAGLTKKNLPRGHFRPLTKEEIRMLKHFT